jgi:hypothetical protein
MTFYEMFLNQIKQIRYIYKKNKKEGHVICDQTLPRFITATVVDWIDVFIRQSYK